MGQSLQPLYLAFNTPKNPTWFYIQNRKNAWIHTRSTRISPLEIFAGSKSRPRFSKPLQKQPGTPCAAQRRASATALVSCIQARQGGLSLLFQPKHRWDRVGFAHGIPARAVPFQQEELKPPQTYCLAHWLPCKDLSPASGLLGAFFIQLPP